MPEHQLTRRCIYELVWSKPMIKVAEDLGISDVGLKKICDKHRVPTPPRGHWAKLAAGKPTKQPLLHATTDPQDEWVTIYGWQQNLEPSVLAILQTEKERRKARVSASTNLASDQAHITLSDLHRWLKPTAKALRAGKPDLKGLVGASGPGQCGVSVSTSQVERAIVVLNMIIVAAEGRNLKLEAVGSSVRASTHSDDLQFTLTETIKRQKHLPTLDELSKEDRIRKKRQRDAALGIWSFDREQAYPEFDYISTGELKIEIANRYVSGLRRSWSDGKRQKLETMIDDLVGGMIAYLAGIEAERLKRERWERNRGRQAERAALARERNERESKRLTFLTRATTTMKELDELNALLVRVKASMPADNVGQLCRLINWAETRADRLSHQLTPGAMNAELDLQKLFPDPDPLLRTIEDDE